MTNAKEEFLEHTKGKKVSCAKITFGDPSYEDEDVNKYFILPVGYDPTDLELFLKEISFSVSKYGYNEAKQLAIEARAKMLQDARKDGITYSDRHGKSDEFVLE